MYSRSFEMTLLYNTIMSGTIVRRGCLELARDLIALWTLVDLCIQVQDKFSFSFSFAVTLRPNAGHGLLILEVF